MGANLLGCFLGLMVVRFLNQQEFAWTDDVWGKRASLRGLLSRAFSQLTPFSWHPYQWHFFKTPKRLALGALMIAVVQIFQLNGFFLFHVFRIPAENPINGLRMLLLWQILIPGASEFYEYTSETSKRLGMNAWLYFALLTFEILNVVKHMVTVHEKEPIKPVPVSVYLPWLVFAVLFSIWCSLYYLSRNRSWFQWSRVVDLGIFRVVLSRDIVLKLLLALAVLPLFSLAQNWAS